jgi:hypothetical protein
MARIFYTERDIEDLARQGVKEIQVNDSVYITDAARERMDKLGITRRSSGNPSGAAPAAAGGGSTKSTKAADAPNLTPAERDEVIQKVKSGVIARLGPGVDAAVVDQIVRRVVGAL